MKDLQCTTEVTTKYVYKKLPYTIFALMSDDVRVFYYKEYRLDFLFLIEKFVNEYMKSLVFGEETHKNWELSLTLTTESDGSFTVKPTFTKID